MSGGAKPPGTIHSADNGLQTNPSESAASVDFIGILRTSGVLEMLLF